MTTTVTVRTLRTGDVPLRKVWVKTEHTLWNLFGKRPSWQLPMHMVGQGVLGQAERPFTLWSNGKLVFPSHGTCPQVIHTFLSGESRPLIQAVASPGPTPRGHVGRPPSFTQLEATPGGDGKQLLPKRAFVPKGVTRPAGCFERLAPGKGRFSVQLYKACWVFPLILGVSTYETG